MKHKDVKIGMKVVPHSKTAKGFEGLCDTHTATEFLYVNGFNEDEGFWFLDNSESGTGDFFNASDFEPYNENKTQTTKKENKQMESKQPTQKEITQQAKRERGLRIKEIRELMGIKKIIKNQNVVVYLYQDGTKIVEKCCKEDKFDWEVSIALQFIHRKCGSKALFKAAVDKIVDQNVQTYNKK